MYPAVLRELTGIPDTKRIIVLDLEQIGDLLKYSGNVSVVDGHVALTFSLKRYCIKKGGSVTAV